MDNFRTTEAGLIRLASLPAQLQYEHVLQRDRDIWKVINQWPYLAIDHERLQARAQILVSFPVFSAAQLWQNLAPKDLSHRLIGLLGGGGTTAGLGLNGRAFVEGKANAKAHTLVNWNEPLSHGMSPWCAQGTHFIYVDGPDLFQHNFANLDTTGRFSRPVSVHFDFTELSELGHRYNTEFLNGPKDVAPDLDALAVLLDRIFELNSMSLAAAEAFHAGASVGMTSIDYDAPALTKYDRLAHDKAGSPKVEICYALLHYEKAIKEFNEVKAHSAAGTMDLTLLSGTYCVVAVAACIEAIANNLVYLQTGEHPTTKNPHTPLEKINVAAEHLIAQSGGTYQPLRKGQDIFDILDTVRVLRNGFMHAKEHQTDIDPDTRTSTTLTQVDEVACRNYLKRLRQAVDNVYGQLPHLAPPIVVRTNMTWMGELEVP